MSARPAVLDPVVQPFVDAGLRVTVQGSYLLLHDVPVVDRQKRLQLGTLVATLIYTEQSVTPPSTHQVWFDGPFPCFADGVPMNDLSQVPVAGRLVAPGVAAQFHFSNKPDGWTHYDTHYDQLMHYWRLITTQAQVIDPDCTATLAGGSTSLIESAGPFRYPDACSVKGNFVMASNRLSNQRVAIVGLGGTGSYVLDQVAKTPVGQIHLFDGDVFEMHNAFRAPGAALEAAFGTMKVRYFAEFYSPMRNGIVEHPSYVTELNVALLGQFDFVFVCVDKGPARKLVCAHLIECGVPFADCGMDMSMTPNQEIYGTCRVTVATPEKHDHFFDRAPTMEDAGDAMYGNNIQIADANALNAMLAVIRWKQHFGFYSMLWKPHQLEFTIATMGLAKAETIGSEHENL